MKMFFLLLLICGSLSVVAQSSIEYVEVQVQLVEDELRRLDQNWKLDNIQKQQLIKIFQDKFKAIEPVLKGNFEKSIISDSMNKIDREFRPKVESVMSFEQRLAISKSSATKLK